LAKNKHDQASDAHNPVETAPREGASKQASEMIGAMKYFTILLSPQ